MVSINQFNSNEKIIRYLDKLDYYFNGHKTLIVTELDLTNRCNNNCPGCTGMKENQAELSWGDIQKIVAGLKEVGNQGIIISGGGEPLLSPYFAETLELIKNSGMKIGVNSNGLALTNEKTEAICNCCEYCRISLDAGSPEMYLKTHGMSEEAFHKVIDNMKMVSKLRKEKKSMVSFGAGFLTSKETVEDMESFVRLCKDAEVDFAQFRPFTGDEYDISEEYLRLKDKYETEDFKVSASVQKYRQFGSDQKRSYDHCHGMFFSTVVTADAKIYACLHHRQENGYLIGNIKEKDIPEIWRSYKKQEVFENINVHQCPPFCRNDSFNRTLNLLDLDVVHKEFL